MGKKNFKGGIDSLFGSDSNEAKNKPTNKGRGRPKTNFKEITKESQRGTKPNETRATFIVNEDYLEALKALAFWDRVSIKDVLGEALKTLVDSRKKDLSKALESYKGKA